MKLSTSTCDLRNGTMETPEHIRLLTKTGFHHFNLSLTGPGERLNTEDWENTIQSIKAALEETGSDCPLAHAIFERGDTKSYESMLEEIRRAIVACERLGIPDLVIHPRYNSALSAKGVYKLNHDFFTDILATRPDTPVHLLAENAADTEVSGSCFCSGADLVEFVTELDDPHFGICWDTAHCALSRPPRDNQYDSIIAMGSYLRALHVSDNFGHGMHWHSFPFNGSINFDSIMCGLTEIGYKGAFNFEASYIARSWDQPPFFRNKWQHPTNSAFEPKLFEPPIELKMKADELLYAAGKYILESYGVFEE